MLITPVPGLRLRFEVAETSRLNEASVVSVPLVIRVPVVRADFRIRTTTSPDPPAPPGNKKRESGGLWYPGAPSPP
jgi:hypothetical protein